MRILGVNGIHNWSWSKDSFTDRLLDALSQRNAVVDVEYPRMLAILAYFESAIVRRARKIVEANQPGDVLIAHSFGCLASIYAMEMGARFSKVFFFGAACDENILMPAEGFDVLYNIHSDTDSALALGMKLPAHKFGGCGRVGYLGGDKRVVNFGVTGLDHNDYVTPRHLCEWVKFIEERITDRRKVAA